MVFILFKWSRTQGGEPMVFCVRKELLIAIKVCISLELSTISRTKGCSYSSF